jgi:hypothetical protein
MEHEPGHHRHERLVDVHDVECFALEEAADARLEPDGARDAGDRPVGRHRDRASDLNERDTRLRVEFLRRGGEHGDPVAEARELVRQVGDVAGDSAGIGEIVRGHQCDLHVLRTFTCQEPVPAKPVPAKLVPAKLVPARMAAGTSFWRPRRLISPAISK